MSKRLFPVLQFLDDAGVPLSGGLIYTYNTGGSSTPKATYIDAAGSSTYANPIVLSAFGRPTSGSIWLDTDIEYRFIIKDSTAAETFATIDHVTGIIDPLEGVYSSDSIQFEDGAGLLDSNGNDVLIIDSVANAVNYTEVANAATGNGVSISAKGSNSNVDITLASKGTTGKVKFVVYGNTITLPTDVPTAGQFLTTDEDGNWDYGANTGLLAGQRSGMVLSNGTDATHDINISAGSRRDSSDTVTILKASAFTKQIDATWTAGTNAGGLASGVSYSSSTWYHVFVIQHTNGTVDYGFDTSITAANLLSGSSYTYYRYLGSFLTDSGSAIIAFLQDNDIFSWTDPTVSFTTTTLSTTRTAAALSVPPGVRSHVYCNTSCTNASATSIYVANGNSTDSAPSSSAAPLASLYCGAGLTVQAQVSGITDTSSQLQVRATNSSTTLKLAVIHYRNLGL